MTPQMRTPFEEPEHPAEDMVEEVQGALHELRDEQADEPARDDHGGENDQEADEIGDDGVGNDLVDERPRPRIVTRGQDEAGDDRDEPDDLPDQTLDQAEDQRDQENDQEDDIERVQAHWGLLRRSSSTIQ